MIKLLIISHALVQEAAQARWKLLAESDHFDIRMLIPRTWTSEWFQTKKPQVFTPQTIQRENFEVCPVPTTDERKWGKYLIKNLHKHLKEFSPDVIFCIHTEDVRQLHQTIIYRRLFAPHSKLVYFTMYAFPRVPPLMKITVKNILKKLYFGLRWWHVRHGTDGVLVHCPPIRDQIQKEKYRKPVLLQTQVGVDPDIFRPDPQVRKSLRGKLGLDRFVIGYAGRLAEEKGILDLIAALQDMPLDWQLLWVGEGKVRKDIEIWAKQHAWSDRVKITGYVPMNEVARYMNAMDCFFIGSRTTRNWVDTFPLAVAQAMATGLPVVGSDSGAIPFQLGGKGLIFPEGDTVKLRQCLLMLAEDVSLRVKMGEQLLQRARAEFCIAAMNEKFEAFIQQQILKNEF